MFKIECNHTDPYAETIATFIKQEFPIFVQCKDTALLDLLTAAIVATGKIRFGPAPSPESLVAIRQVISFWIAQQLPIPFLTGWGSEKPDGSGVDIAEMFALKTLTCLNERIKKYYNPGAIFHIRVEDASAPHLFYDRMEQARIDAAHYTAGMVGMARALGVEGYIRVIPESSMFSEETFNRTADAGIAAIQTHISDPTNEEYRAYAASVGFTNPLSPETLDYYLTRYLKLYPDATPEKRQYILARYFAAACARYKLGHTGADRNWGKNFLELAFHTPAPGIPPARAAKRIYYRTMPCSISSNHAAPWRVKGFLKVGNSVTASLTSFNSTEFTFNPNTIIAQNGEHTQEIKADYVIVD